MKLAEKIINEVKMSDIIKQGDKAADKKVKEIVSDMRSRGKSDKEIIAHLKPIAPMSLIKKHL